MAGPQNAPQLLASLAEAERTLASARPKRHMSSFDLFAASLKRQYNIQEGTANISRIMQLITEAWHNLPPAERAPFDAHAREDMQRYQQEERVYDQMQMQYSRLKQIAQQSGALQAGTAVLQAPQPQRQMGAAPAAGTNSLLAAYSQAAAQANFQQQQQQRMAQQYAYQTQQQQQQPATAGQPQLQAAAHIAQQAQQRQQQGQRANPTAQTQQQQSTGLLLALANAVDRNNNNGGRLPAAPAPAPQLQRPAAAAPPRSSAPPQLPVKRPHPSSRAPRPPETVEIVCNGVNGTLLLSEQMVVCGCSSCINLSQSKRTMSCTQFEHHSGSGGVKKWKQSLKVRPGTEPEVPRGILPMPIGRWLEIKGIDLALVPPRMQAPRKESQRAVGSRQVAPPLQYSEVRPNAGFAPPQPSGNKVPLQYQWKGGPSGGGSGGGGGGGFAPVGKGGAFAPPSFPNNSQLQQQQRKQYQPQYSQPSPSTQGQYGYGSSQRYSAAAVAARQQERATAAAAAAAAAAKPAAPVGRPPSGSSQYRYNAHDAGNSTKTGPYTPWRDANDGKFTSINVRWSGERCSVCDADTDSDYDQLITCDMCGITVHQSCYGVQDVPGVDQMWFCRACELHQKNGSGGGHAGATTAQCCLCPVAGGALKPTTINGVWAHVACLQWIPEVSVDDPDAMEPISGIRTIQRERWELMCYLCKQRMGAKIQCKSCYYAYHPLCARIAGFKMEIKDGPRGPDGPVVCTSYCGKHSPPQPHLSGVRKVEESEAGGDLPDFLPKPRLWNGQPYPLPRCLQVPKSAAGCARAMEYDLVGRKLVRKQHGTGSGATTEAGFWIPGSIIDLSEEEEGFERDEQKREKKRKNVEMENADDGGDDDGGGESRRSSRRINSKRSHSNGPGSAAENQEEEEQEEGTIEKEKLVSHEKDGGDATVVDLSSKDAQVPRNPTSGLDTVDINTTTNTTNTLLLPPGIQRVDSPPGTRAIETALRPAVKKASSIDGDRPPAKLRKLNSLQAEEEKPASFTPPPEAAKIETVGTVKDTTEIDIKNIKKLPSPAPGSNQLSGGLVAQWCRIWWPEDNEWYVGIIKEYSPAKGQFRVWYEIDNEAEWIDLGKEMRNNRVQLLHGEDRKTWPGPLPPPYGGIGESNERTAGKTTTLTAAAAAGIKGGENGVNNKSSGGGGGGSVLNNQKEKEQDEVVIRGPAEGSDAIGRKLGIYWEDQKRYYYGTVRSYRTDKGHLIYYENGTIDWVDLSSCRVDWKVMKISASTANASKKRTSTGAGENLDNDPANGLSTRNRSERKDYGKEEEEEEEEVDHQVAVVCNGVRGTFHSRSLTVTLSHSDKEVSPGEFERISGRGPAKKWKATIRVDDGDGVAGKPIESWLIGLGIWGEDGKPLAIQYVGPRLKGVQQQQQQNQQQHQHQVQPTRATAETYSRRRQPVRVQNGKGAHRDDCNCIICKQSRRTGKGWAGFAANLFNSKSTAGGGRGAGRKQRRNINGGGGGDEEEEEESEGDDGTQIHDPNTVRTGKQAYLEAIPQITSTGPRSLELYQAPPSRCWTPGEWAAHRLLYNMKKDARQSKNNVENSTLASLGHYNTLPVVVSGGSRAICDGNLASEVSLGPGATGFGRTLTLKEKLDLCTATEHERLSFGKSGIHGWGLYAKVPMRQDTMVVEFRGELLRRSAAEMREEKYRAQGADCYIFNLDDDVVLDATRAGTIARFTNHSCSPSLYTKILALEGELRLTFFARVDISPGQELTYNYRFKAEDDEEKMVCHCGAPNCIGYLN